MTKDFILKGLDEPRAKYRVVKEFVDCDGKTRKVGEIGIVPANTQGTYWLGAGEIPIRFEGENYILGVDENYLEWIDGLPFEPSTTI